MAVPLETMLETLRYMGSKQNSIMYADQEGRRRLEIMVRCVDELAVIRQKERQPALVTTIERDEIMDMEDAQRLIRDGKA